MAIDNSANKSKNSEEVSLMEIGIVIKRTLKYLKTKWIFIALAIVIGISLGLAYAIVKKPIYSATSTFVLEDSKSSSLGQYAGLASIAGINIGDGGGGIFEGDNILELYTSRVMIKKALLTSCIFNNKKQLLIDRYIDYYKLRKTWMGNPELKDINFNTNPDSLNRKQDSIITSLVDLFNVKVLNVSKPDKKLSIIRVDVSTKDELFSKCFNETLVATVNDFYVQTKTKKAYQNVLILQHEADSIKMILNSSLNGVASANDASPNSNPLMSTLKVPSQKRQIDLQANSAIYSEVVKNLELAKISLRQETPLIQVVDEPVLPLSVDRAGKVKCIFIGFILGAFISISLILFIKISSIFINKLQKI
jgi:hypothetical protein